MANYYVSRTNTLRALQLSCILQKSHKNHKENEHVENIVFDDAAILFFRKAVLGCCSQHSAAAARNSEICRRRLVHGCRKADVKQA